VAQAQIQRLQRRQPADALRQRRERIAPAQIQRLQPVQRADVLRQRPSLDGVAMVKTLKNKDGTLSQPISNVHDVPPKDADAIWRRWFHFNSVETQAMRFAHRIVTDGCSATVVLDRPAAFVLSTVSGEWTPEALKTTRPMTFAGVDPGMSDVVTVSRTDGAGRPATVTSYSASRYYEKSKIKASKRRTDKWNAETAAEVASLRLDVDRSTADGMRQHITAYLAVVRGLIRHRMEKGYRNMRFMRRVHKAKAVSEICDLIAPPGQFTIVGYGNWGGPSASCPISRRFCGPQQAVKRELWRRRMSVGFRDIDEFRTSILDSETWQRMANMVAKSIVYNKSSKEMAPRAVSRIHKVLHCKTSVIGLRRSKTTWNRDANAAHNILMLLMTELHGYDRPREFCR
jgi:hypothetical protein